MKLLPLLVLALILTIGCGSKSPTSPSVTPPTTTPLVTTPPAPTAPTLVTLAGTVSNQAGARLSGATVAILDGANAGRFGITNSAGEFTIPDLQRDNANLAARAAGYEEKRGGLFIDGTRSVAFTMFTAVPWSRSGVGDTVFDMPTYLTRVRVTGTYTRNSSNFIVRVGGRLLVNELLGTGWSTTRYDGTLLTTGGVVEITNSSGVAWSFTEVR